MTDLAPNFQEARDAWKQVLSERLNILLDVMVASGGEPYEFEDIKKGLEEQGVTLSRSRWLYMRQGTGTAVTDEKLLTALANFFGVNPAYLNDFETDIPERIEKQLKALQTMREKQVVNFAARSLSGISPEKIQAIAEILGQEPDTKPSRRPMFRKDIKRLKDQQN